MKNSFTFAIYLKYYWSVCVRACAHAYEGPQPSVPGDLTSSDGQTNVQVKQPFTDEINI